MYTTCLPANMTTQSSRLAGEHGCCILKHYSFFEFLLSSQLCAIVLSYSRDSLGSKLVKCSAAYGKEDLIP